MRVKFTLRTSKYRLRMLLLTGLASLLAILPVSAQRKGQQSPVPDQLARKLQQERNGFRPGPAASIITDLPGSAVVPGLQGVNVHSRTAAVCTVITGSLTAGDPSFTSGRLTRNGVPSSCAVNKTCPGLSLVGTSYRYKTHTFTNPIALPQCITVTHQNTGPAGSPHLSIHNGAFSPANICTNYLADYGASPTPGNSVTFTFTLAASATITLVVTETTAGQLGSYTITLDGCQPACTGTPAPGNTISSVSATCPGVNFNLSLQNATPGAGVSYQWQSAPAAAGPWTDIPGATNATLSRNQLVLTWYRCNVTCSGNTGTSNPVQVGMNPPLSCYCIPPATDCTDDDVILRVRLNTLDNASTCGTGPPAGYSDFTSTVGAPVLFAGAPNPVIVNVPATYTEQIAVWIDYNLNGQFDASEYTNLGSSTGTGGMVTGNISIPASVAPGTTRMRVRTRFASALGPGDACLPYVFGETEDYSINIQPCVPVSFASQPENDTTNCSGNAGFSVTTNGSLPVYRWQYRTSSSGIWQYVPAASPFSGERTSSLTLTNVSGAYNGYQFRATVEGGCSALDFSSPATLTVTPLVATVNPASAAICTGSVQQLTLTNAPAPYEFSSGPISLAIPDNTANGVSNSIAVSGLPALVPTRISLRLNLPHTYPGDMIIHLKAPNGNILNLYKYNGGSFTGLTGVPNSSWYDAEISSTATQAFNTVPSPYQYGITSPVGPFKPDALNTAVSGPVIQNPAGFVSNATGFGDLVSVLNGNWTLALADGGNLDLGTLNSWSISFSFGVANGVWSGPDGTMWTDAATTIPYVAGSLANSIWVNPAVTSNYSVVYNTSTPCASAPTTIPVTVMQPVSGVVNPANRSVCVGGSTTFTASASGGPLTYQWQLSTDGGLTYNNITGATASTYTLSGATLSMNGYRYRCVFTAAPCVGSTASTGAILTVNALPVVTLSSPDLSLIPGQFTSITATSTPAAAAGGWVWNYNGNTISGNNTNTVSGITVDQLGAYHATVTDINGCSSTSADLVVTAEASDHLWIYPNPTEGVFHVRLYYDPSTTAEIRRVFLYNAQGQLIESRDFALTNSAPYLRMDFDLSRQADGTYVVKVVHKYTGKIVSGLLVKQTKD